MGYTPLHGQKNWIGVLQMTIILQIILLALFLIGGYLLRVYELKPFRFGLVSGVVSLLLILYLFLCDVFIKDPMQYNILMYVSFQLALAGFIMAMFGVKYTNNKSLEQQERLYAVLIILGCLIIMFFIALLDITGLRLVITLSKCNIYLTLLAIITPLVIGYALRGYQFWNGLLSLAILFIVLFVSVVLFVDAGVVLSPTFIGPSIIMAFMLFMIIPTLLSLFSQLYDEYKIFSIITLSLIAFVPMVIIN